MYTVKWENLKIRKTVRVNNHWTCEMVAEKFGGNADDWQIIVC